MGLADRLKDLKAKAVDATAERSDKIHEAVEKVATTADERTGGKYHDRIQKAGAKAAGLVDSVAAGSEQQPAGAAEGAPDDGAQAGDAGAADAAGGTDDASETDASSA
ncbi:MAG TPA: antitoxin [Solirubrobacteraceae bacterium]|jgi:hypothetical protein|nr:antitoxin [Solirubrobacteraceae bacterium]